MRQAVVVVWVVLLFAAPVQADFLQWGADARRTGQTSSGPQHFDVALDIRLEALHAPNAPPLIIGRDVYVLTEQPDPSLANEADAPVADAVGLWRIRSTTGDAKLIFDLAGSNEVETMASDGQRIFLVDGADVVAVDLAGGLLWKHTMATAEGRPGKASTCVPPAVARGELVLACHIFLDSPDPQAVGTTADLTEVIVIGLDVATGDLIRNWYRRDLEKSPSPVQQSGPTSADDDWRFGTALAVGPRHAYWLSIDNTQSPHVHDCVVNSTDGREAGASIHVWAIDGNGTLDWVWTTPVDAHWFRPPVVTDPQDPQPPGLVFGAMAVLDETVVVAADGLHAMHADSGCPAWERSFDAARTERGGQVLAVAENDILVGTGTWLWRVEQDGSDAAWEPVQHAPFSWQPGLLAGDRHAFAVSEGGLAFALDLEDGRDLWTRPVDIQRARPGYFAAADGLYAIIDRHSRVLIVGDSPAAPDIRVDVPDAYPAFGQNLTIDLSGSRPGVQAEDMEFRVAWGDGSTEPWSNATRFEHAYVAPPDFDPDDTLAVATLDPVVGTVFVRNSAGQESRQSFTVYPGMPAPRLAEDETMLSRAFAQENQEATFFMLGVILTMLTTIFGGWRLSSKRRRLRAELARVEEQEQIGRRDAGEAEKGLRLLEGRAADLLAMRKLDEAQYAVLSDRIQTVRRRVRVGVIEDDLGFLPMKVARRLQGMLADGSLDAWERGAIVEAVEAVPELTAAHRKATLQQVDVWFEADRA